jgi:SAM-dependent methyltransferase
MSDKTVSKLSQDPWTSSKDYELYVGRWSRLVAHEFLNWLNVGPGCRWLDVGCGSMALSQTILAEADPRYVKGIDQSESYISYARQTSRDRRVHFEIGDAQTLSDDSATYDAVVSGFVLNFIYNPAQSLSEMMRVVKPGGLVATYVWDYAGKMQMLRHFWNAAAALDPNAADLDEGRRFPLCRPRPIKELFRSAGLKQIEVRAIDISTDFKDFDDYWSPFMCGQGPAPGYVLSLSEEKRVALRQRIRSGLPVALDGSIPLVARSWAVRGMR